MKPFIHVVVALAAAASAPLASAQLQVPTRDGERPSLAPLLKEVTPAVVNIAVTSTAVAADNPLLEDPFFRRFFGAPDRQPNPIPQQSVGSGVIVDAEKGYVLTNHHVVASADDIEVTLTDRRTVAAELVGSDPGTDIALLKIEPSGLKDVPFADSDELQVGDFVVAIGDPFGLGQTVTSGIVSALGRSGINIEGYEDFIQTDASINPGNSGGALIDLDGRLVGINTAILSQSGGNIGIGFAVPVNMAKQAMVQLIEHGEVRRGQLGVTIQTLSPDLAEALGARVKAGAVITSVLEGSPGDRAGLQQGDVVVEFGGAPVEDASDLRNRVGLSPLGQNVPMKIVREGRERQLNVTIEPPSGQRAGGTATGTIDELDGATFRDFGPGDPEFDGVRGALVARLEPSSPAVRSGLRPGDVVIGVNRTPVQSAAELSAALRNAQGRIALNVMRDGGRLYVVVR